MFGCLFPKMRDLWFGCGYIFQDESCLTYLGVCMSRMWGLWFPCVCMSQLWGLGSLCEYSHQNGRSLICLWAYVPEYEVTDLFVHIGPGFDICDLLVTIIISVWDVSHGCMPRMLSSLICLWLYEPGYEVSCLFVHVYLSVWGLKGLFGCEVSDLFGGLFTRIWVLWPFWCMSQNVDMNHC